MTTKIIAKSLIFDRGGKLLLLTRSTNDNHRPGEFDLPGGNVEKGEDIVSAVIREAEEEAGLTIDQSKMHWVYADTVSAYNTDVGSATNMVRITFVTSVENPEVVISPEHDAFAWYNLEEALELLNGTRYRQVLSHMIGNGIAREHWSKK